MSPGPWLLVLAAAADPGAGPAAPGDGSTAPPARFAVVVGLNLSDDPSRPTLRFADDDAARFFELVSRGAEAAHLLTVFDETSQRLYPELVAVARAPSRSELERVLTDVAQAVDRARDGGRPTEIHFYYAGHGDVDDGVGYVTLTDGRWSRRDLEQQLLRRVQVDVGHVVIDACKSYFMVSGRGPGGQRSPAPSAYAGPALHPGYGFVLSTSSDAESHEFAELDAGVFSHEVRSALLGAADVDADGAVDYAELGAFVAAANEGVTIERYRPQVFVRPPTGRAAAPLLRPRALVRLGLGPDVRGRIQITDPRGLRHADLNKAPGTSLQVGLLHRGLHEVRVDEARYEIRTGREDVLLAGLDPSEANVESRGIEHEAFERLFSTPFSPDVVRGFRMGQQTEGVAMLSPPPPDRTGRDWGTALTAGGGASVLAGAIFAAVAADQRASAGAAGLDQVERNGRLDGADAWTGAAIAALSAGGAALVTGIVLLVADGRP